MLRTAHRLAIITAPTLLANVGGAPSPTKIATRFFAFSAPLKMATDGKQYKNAASIYEFKAKDIDGNEVSLDKYRDRVVIVVNVACECGFTPKTYPQLQEMYQKYEADGLRIAAFPCNQFKSQEPLPEPEIKKYVQDKFGVTFDMYSKIDVNGDHTHELYKYLKHKQGGLLGDFIKWNFTKFLVDRNGQPIKRYGPNDEPKNWEDDVVKALGVQKRP